MGAPKTLPADFQGWDQQPANGAPPSTLPPDFDKWDQPQAQQTSAASRFGNNFLSGLGVVSDEQAKNFFLHPVNTAMGMVNAQGELAQKAKDAYVRGDYKSAVIHGLNYLVPFIGQQTDKAGEQLSHGDIAGGIGRTLGVAVPIAAGSPEARGMASDAASATVDAASKVAQAVGKVTPKQIAQGTGVVTGAGLGHGTLSIPGAYYGAKGAGSLAEGILGKEFANKPIGLPNRVTGGPAEAPAYQPGTAGSMAESVSQSAESVATTPTGAGLPRTLSGESALGQVLSRLDNSSLIRIARSRGLNVSQESLLKPGTANNLLINKIAKDFSPDELQEFSARYLENSRFQHQFSNQMTPEAWSTVAMKSYFPEVRIPQTVLGRTQKAMAATDPVVQQATKIRRR